MLLEDDEPDPLDEVECVVFEDGVPKWKAQWIHVRRSRCTEAQRRRLAALRLEIGLYDDQWRERLGVYCKSELRELSYDEAEDLEEKLIRRLRDHGTEYERRARQERRYQEP